MCAAEQYKGGLPVSNMDHWNFELLWRANCDLTTHNAQGQGSRFRGRMGDVAGGAKWRMPL